VKTERRGTGGTITRKSRGRIHSEKEEMEKGKSETVSARSEGGWEMKSEEVLKFEAVTSRWIERESNRESFWCWSGAGVGVRSIPFSNAVTEYLVDSGPLPVIWILDMSSVLRKVQVVRSSEIRSPDFQTNARLTRLGWAS
jgi:hypothetical protein